MNADKVRENRLRRQATRLGLILKKSRAKMIHADNLGGYMIIDNDGNVASGSKFELNIDDVTEFLNEYEENLKNNTR